MKSEVKGTATSNRLGNTGLEGCKVSSVLN